MRKFRILTILAVAAALSISSGAIGVSASDPETVEIEGTITPLTGTVTPELVPNEFVRLPNSLIGQPGPGGILETFRFDSGDVSVQSGGTVRWANTTQAPHTITIVRRSDQPQNLDAAFACFAGICGTTQARHFPQGFDPITHEPIEVVPDLGSLNIGDSHLVGPVGGPFRTSFTAKVTAAPGTVLFFMCVLHPQMQSKIVVEGD